MKLYFKFGIMVIVVMVLELPVAYATLGIGLSGEEIQIQEYWYEGTPFYIIANSSDSTVVLSAGEYDYRAGDVDNWKDRYQLIVAKWTIPPRSSRTFDISVLTSYSLVYLQRDGKSIGLLNGPRVPRNGLKSTYITCGGLNIGGSDWSDRMWLEQESMYFEPDSSTVFTIVIRNNCGRVGFGPYTELWRMVNRRKDGKPSDENQNMLKTISVESESLQIEKRNGIYIVDTTKILKEVDYHRIEIKCRFPESRQLVAKLIGFHWYEDGPSGSFLTRGYFLAERK